MPALDRRPGPLPPLPRRAPTAGFTSLYCGSGNLPSRFSSRCIVPASCIRSSSCRCIDTNHHRGSHLGNRAHVCGPLRTYPPSRGPSASCYPPPRHRPPPSPSLDIELVTQVSLDRWPRFVQQAAAWGGPASVAVYLPVPPDHPLEPAYREHLQRLVREFRHGNVAETASPGSMAAAEQPDRGAADDAGAAMGGAEVEAPGAAHPPRLTVTVVHASHVAPEGATVLPGVVPPPVMPPAPTPPPPSLLAPTSVGEGLGAYGAMGALSAEQYGRLYPINALRNAALRAATASHVFLVDGDFIPSAGLRESLLAPARARHTQLQQQGSQQQQHRTASPSSARSAAARGTSGTGSDGSNGGSMLELSYHHRRPAMWVVPAFELVKPPGAAGTSAAVATGRSSNGEIPDDQRASVPRTLEQLAACAGMGVGLGSQEPRNEGSSDGLRSWDVGGGGDSGSLRPFHCGRYPQPVPSIDYGLWWQRALAEGCEGGAEGDSGWMEVPYHEYFEPYGIVRRDQVPEYDERFRGYGLNKVQHAYHMAARGFEFRLLTRHFCVTVPHARSPSYRAAFGSAADPAQRLRVERLYEQFKREMQEAHGYRYSLP